MATKTLTLAEAADLSNNLLVQGVIEDIISVDEWFQYLPFIAFEGLSYTFNREADIASADLAAPGDALNTTAFYGGASFTPVNVHLTAIIGDIIIDGQIEDQLSESNDQLQVQISSKAKAIARKYMNLIINGYRAGSLSQGNNGYIGLATSFNGIRNILVNESANAADVTHPFYSSAGSATMTHSLVEDDDINGRLDREGRTFNLEDLDNIIDRVTAGRPDFIIMCARDLRTLRNLLRNTGGGTDSFQIQQQGLGSQRPRLFYQDIPVFRNDFISSVRGVNSMIDGTVAAVAGAAITTADDWSAGVPTEASEAMTAGTAQCWVRDAAATSLGMYKWLVTSATVASPTVLTCTVSGYFYDDEKLARVAVLAPNDGTVTINGGTYNFYERFDGSEIYVGCFGAYKGVCGFTSANNAGIKLEYVGPREDENAYQYRLKWYVGFELFNRLALARMTDVLPYGA